MSETFKKESKEQITKYFDEYYTEQEVSELFKIPRSTLRKHRCLRQGLPFVKIQGAVRYSLTDIREYLNLSSIRPEREDS